ncbi:MAG: tetratricopeptide repeat protein [Gemmataceae bacterium]
MMRWRIPLWTGVLLVAGCAQTTQERAQELGMDGNHLYRQGAYAEARDQYQAALAMQPQSVDLLFRLASCQDKLGKKQEAEEAYRRVLQQDPNHLAARHALVLRQIESGQREQAVRSVEDWLRASPGNAGPYIEDGWLRAQQGDLDSARGRFQQALQIDACNPRALEELGRIYERLDRPDRAIVLYERSLASDPEQPSLRTHLEQLRGRGITRPRPD